MFPAPLFLFLLIIATPALILIEGPIVHGLIIATAAAAVAVIALRCRPGEARFLSSVIKPVALSAIVLAVWMLIQVVPVNAIGLANPIWKSAAAALERPPAGSISVDPGATLFCLARYLSVTAIAFVAAAVAVDRQRAEWIAIALITAITLIVIMILADNFSGVAFVGNGSLAGQAATDIAGFGIIISLAAAMHMLERRKAQPVTQRELTQRQGLSFLAWVLAVAMCTLAFILNGTSQEFFAVACGVATLAVSVVGRRFYFGPWGYSAIISIAVVVAVAALALRTGNKSLDLTVAYATHAPASLVAVTQRVLMEAGWLGTGAGTFSAVLPIYEDINDLTVGGLAPTAAATIAVELGRPFLWIIMLAAIALVIMLLRGALLRRRDSFYSAAGASCVVAGVLLAFVNAGLFSTPALLITAVIIGTAVAQRKSRLN